MRGAREIPLTGSNLLQWLVEEIETLRTNSTKLSGITNDYGSVFPLNLHRATQLDIVADCHAVMAFNEADVGYNCSTSGGTANRGALGPFGLLVLADRHLREQTAVYFYVTKGLDGSLTTHFCQDESRSSSANDIVKRVVGSALPVLDGETLSLRVLAAAAGLQPAGAVGCGWPASVEQSANSVGLPLSLCMLKQKKQQQHLAHLADLGHGGGLRPLERARQRRRRPTVGDLPGRCTSCRRSRVGGPHSPAALLRRRRGELGWRRRGNEVGVGAGAQGRRGRLLLLGRRRGEHLLGGLGFRRQRGGRDVGRSGPSSPPPKAECGSGDGDKKLVLSPRDVVPYWILASRAERRRDLARRLLLLRRRDRGPRGRARTKTCSSGFDVRCSDPVAVPCGCPPADAAPFRLRREARGRGDLEEDPGHLRFAGSRGDLGRWRPFYRLLSQPIQELRPTIFTGPGPFTRRCCGHPKSFQTWREIVPGQQGQQWLRQCESGNREQACGCKVGMGRRNFNI